MAVTSIKEVARRAGVSVGTVSNVLNRPDMVAPARRQRVLDVIDKLGFVGNESARQLRAGRSRTIGMVVIDVANPFFTDVARGAESVTDDNNSMLMLCSSGEDRNESSATSRCSSSCASWASSSHRSTFERPADRRDREPWHSRGPRGQPVEGPQALFGRRSTTSLAAGWQLSTCSPRDTARIAFVGGPFSLRQVTERHQGARDAIADHPGAPPAVLSLVETPSLTVAAGRAAAVTIAELPAGRRPRLPSAATTWSPSAFCRR